MQNKTERLVANVEPTIAKLARTYCEVNSIKQTEWLRKTIIKELKETGMLTDELLIEITT